MHERDIVVDPVILGEIRFGILLLPRCDPPFIPRRTGEMIFRRVWLPLASARERLAPADRS
jgi:hypothetical protein